MPRKSPATPKPSNAANKDTQSPVLLSGGNPQIAKGDGDAPVQAYLAAVPGWKQAVCSELDRLVQRVVPEVRRAVRWNTPFYGLEDQGWFLAFHCMTKYVKVTFFHGTSMTPEPPVGSKQPEVRYLHLDERGIVDEKQLESWIRQASQLPGEKLF